MNKEQNSILKILHEGLVSKLMIHGKSLDASKITLFWNRLEKCLKSNEYHINRHMGPLAFILDSINYGTGDDMLSPKQLARFLSSGATKKSNCIVIDYDGKRIKDDTYNNHKLDNYKDAWDLAKEYRLKVFFINGLELHVFIGKDSVEFIPNIYSHRRVGTINDSRLPISEYRKLIQDHHDQEVYREKGMKYWQSSDKRLLISSPEIHFQKRLAFYLKYNVVDGFVDQECLNAGTTDRTDIRIIKFEDQDIYIIEIKWLGKSISNNGSITTYGVDKAKEGIVQLTRYLKDEPKAFCSVLVIYDARNEDKEITWDNKNVWDLRMDKNPMRLFLVSESASKEAKRIVKAKKKRS